MLRAWARTSKHTGGYRVDSVVGGGGQDHVADVEVDGHLELSADGVILTDAGTLADIQARVQYESNRSLMHTHALLHTDLYMRSRSHAPTLGHSRMHARMRAHTYTYAPAHTDMHPSTHEHMHTKRTRTRTRTHIHTHTSVPVGCEVITPG